MATRRGIALRRARASASERERRAAARALTPAETAWLLLVPALALAVALIAALGPPLGRFAFTGTHYTYWPSGAAGRLPKPTELARFALTVACALAFAAAIPLAAARPLRLPPRRARAAVASVQLLAVAALAVFWIAQHHVDRYGSGDPAYFTARTVVVACALAALAAVLLARPPLVARLRATAAGGRWTVVCAAVAVAATALWLLPSIFTDADIVYGEPSVFLHVRNTYDEAMSVLDGRSPLVDMATYGALIPYLTALPLAALHASLAAFTTLMTALNALALLAVYAVLRRLTRHPAAALALYLPFLATSLFIVLGDPVARFDYANYFGMFPVRYAGPYLLACLLARQLDGARPRSELPLFAVAGLVVLNNADFGLPALGAALVAVVCARPPRSRGALLALAGRAAAGLALALALVALLTLLRAGTLPHLDRLLAYSRLFGLAGFGNLPTPLLGFHLAILATYVAALATAAVRVVRREPDAPLTGMLAWCGVFGIGTGAYFVYRSHPATLIAAFSIWALTLALLLIAAWRASAARGSLAPSPPVLALLVGVALSACSLAQLPLPWLQVERIARTSPLRPIATPEAVAFVRTLTTPGTTVAILTPTGHRIAWGAGVENPMAYTGMTQMPAVEQLQETIDALRAGGGTMLFLGEPYPPEVPSALQQAGFRSIASDPSSRLIAWRDGG